VLYESLNERQRQTSRKTVLSAEFNRTKRDLHGAGGLGSESRGHSRNFYLALV
jgi:hypothetical protein